VFRYTCLVEILTDRSKRFELGLGWLGNYDGYDLAALSVLSHGPPVRKSLCAEFVRPSADGCSSICWGPSTMSELRR
jgi:hypothetical protein